MIKTYHISKRKFFFLCLYSFSCEEQFYNSHKKYLSGQYNPMKICQFCVVWTCSTRLAFAMETKQWQTYSQRRCYKIVISLTWLDYIFHYLSLITCVVYCILYNDSMHGYITWWPAIKWTIIYIQETVCKTVSVTVSTYVVCSIFCLYFRAFQKKLS